MPSREDTSPRCVSVDNVPKELKDVLKHEVANQAGLSEGHILVEEVVGYHTEQNLARYVFLLDQKRSELSYYLYIFFAIKPFNICVT